MSQPGSDSITTTLRASPEKYQVTIPKEVRQGLDFDGESALLEVDISLVKILDENEGGDE